MRYKKSESKQRGGVIPIGDPTAAFNNFLRQMKQAVYTICRAA